MTEEKMKDKKNETFEELINEAFPGTYESNKSFLENVKDALAGSLSTFISHKADMMLEKEQRDQEEDRRKESLNYFAPYVRFEDELDEFLLIFAQLNKKEEDQDIVLKIRQLIKTLYDCKLDNPFNFLKRFLINEYFDEISEKYINSFDRHAIPHGITSAKLSDDLEDPVLAYTDELDNYFYDQIESLRDELERKFVQLLKIFLKPENYKLEKLEKVLEELVEKLDLIWGSKEFNIKNFEYEPDIEFVTNIHPICYPLIPKNIYNDNTNFFSSWDIKSKLEESEIKEYQRHGKSNVKYVVNLAKDRFVKEINQTLFPLDKHLNHFAKIIVKLYNNN